MGRSRMLILLLGVVILLGGGLAVVLLSQSGGGGGVAAPTPTPESPLIVVVVQPISQGEQVVSGTIDLRPWPGGLPEGYLLSEDEALGQYVRFDIPAGLPLLSAMLSETRSKALYQESELPKQIPAGKVAVALPVTRLSSVAYALQPGDHVDALASFLVLDLDQEFQTRLPNDYTLAVPGGGADDQTITFIPITPGGRERDPVFGFPTVEQPAELQRPRLVAQLTVQDMVVLGVGDWLSQQEESVVAAPTPRPGQPEPTPAPQVVVPPDIITVLMDPQDALVLKFLRETGAVIDLALRSSEDGGQTFSTEAVTLQYMFARFAITQPPKLTFGTEPRLPYSEENQP